MTYDLAVSSSPDEYLSNNTMNQGCLKLGSLNKVSQVFPEIVIIIFSNYNTNGC